MARFRVNLDDDELNLDMGLGADTDVDADMSDDDDVIEINVDFNEDNDSEFSMGFNEDDNDLNADVIDNVTVTKTYNVSEHNELPGRDASDAHPMSAITGLESKFAEIENHLVTDEERTAWNNKSRVYRNASGALVITR